MTDQLVRSRHLPAALRLEALAGVAMRRRHQPAVRVHVELMHADLVRLAASDEPRVEDEVVLARLRVVVRGVVARRPVARGDRRRLAGDGQELPVAHQLHAEGLDGNVVEQRAGPPRHVREVVARGVEVRAIGMARPAKADVVPAVCVEAAEREEHVVVVGGGAEQDERAFDPAVVPADQLLPVSLARQREAGGAIELEDEDPARVGAVHHPQLPGLVEEHVGIDGIGMPGRIVVRAVGARLAEHAGPKDHAEVPVGARDRHPTRRRPARRSARPDGRRSSRSRSARRRAGSRRAPRTCCCRPRRAPPGTAPAGRAPARCPGPRSYPS